MLGGQNYTAHSFTKKFIPTDTARRQWGEFYNLMKQECYLPLIVMRCAQRWAGKHGRNSVEIEESPRTAREEKE